MRDNVLRDVYENLAAGVAYVAVRSTKWRRIDWKCFSCWRGSFVTARHVFEGKEILEIATTERAIKDIEGTNREGGSRQVTFTHWPGKGKIIGGPYYHPNPKVDVAAFKVEGIDAPIIPLGDHLDDWLGTLSWF